MFPTLVKISIILPSILILIYMTYPLVIFSYSIITRPTEVFNIRLQTNSSSINNGTAVINASLSYNIPVKLKDFTIRLGDSINKIDVLSPGNYSLIFLINTDDWNSPELVDLEISFKIEGVYRVRIKVVNWLRLRD